MDAVFKDCLALMKEYFTFNAFMEMFTVWLFLLYWLKLAKLGLYTLRHNGDEYNMCVVQISFVFGLSRVELKMITQR